MTLHEQIESDFKEAMLAKETVRVAVLRSIKASILKLKTSGADVKIDDSAVLNLIGKEMKQRKDSFSQYSEHGRKDLADVEEAEIKVLEAYLPEQMSEEELKAIIQETITQVGASSSADIGKLMGALMPKIKGKADGGLANKIVKELLS